MEEISNLGVKYFVQRFKFHVHDFLFSLSSNRIDNSLVVCVNDLRKKPHSIRKQNRHILHLKACMKVKNDSD